MYGPASAPIIVSALFAPADQAWFEGLRQAHFPPERNLIAAHLTLFHHLPPAALPELRARLAEAARSPPPDAAVASIMNLGRGTALRIASAGLETIRAGLAAHFAGSLTPQDAGGWRPHVTIQNKVTPEAGRRLQAELASLALPRPVRLHALAAWWYRDGPWEAIRAWPFRG